MFQSTRLRLRKMQNTDISLYHQWRNDHEVMASTSLVLDVYTYEETQSFVENVMLSSAQSKSYIIEELEHDTPIGVISLIGIDYKNRNAECILDIGEKSKWGKGYGTEALSLLLTYAFYELNLHRLSLRVFSTNEKAIHLYKKVGFVQEGRIKEAVFRNGGWIDIIHMGLLQTHYQQLL
ncbi:MULTISPECIES: GNAT family N-acetyltransferase [Shouchella]|uniref:GNAT family protein n=2 Tax=Shouchella TaxID=2893057 RepID=A0ABY7W0C9_9BACI|nr:MULTISPECIES: GNAT family protein [Shouchella]MED4130200.1 GNAT family protein [Shouchella miscanthi]WDF02387.1 GNAT family protein [Shouchella hunanensis]GAF21966.1 acetyltransferase, GNAT family [Bacillus sp. JCM 19047]